MKGFKFFMLLLVMCGWLSSVGYPEIYCKIKGRVIDAETKEGIPDVFVDLHLFRHDSPEEFYTLTDVQRVFHFFQCDTGPVLFELCPTLSLRDVSRPGANANQMGRFLCFEKTGDQICGTNAFQGLRKLRELVINQEAKCIIEIS